MKKSFSSFREIFASFPMPERWLPDYKKYLAHLPGPLHEGVAPETLQEHITLVNSYAQRLIDAHGLDVVVDTLISDVLEKYEMNDKVGQYLKEMLASVIHFHDYGKVNPNFQVRRMNNRAHFRENRAVPIGAEHSRLSTYLFLHTCFSRIDKDFEDEEAQTFLKVFAFLMSNAITRHHASAIEHKVNLERDHLQRLTPFLKTLDIEDGNKKHNDLIENWQKLFAWFHDNWQESNQLCFSEVVLVKLCFSLLTASDFCATFEYMNGVQMQEWGVISEDDKQRYIDSFRTRKPYNKALSQDFEHFRDTPFSSLQARSTDNLNSLRQKLAANAIATLRTHPDDRLFFLEAPTGGGKTNVSLALALELLQSDQRLNKVIYVFPFTTLVTQTYQNIRDTLGLDASEIVELHARASLAEREEKQDGIYGSEKRNYIANLFANFPFTLMTHVRFFDILKSNRKEINYLLHRMANAVVIIDELQAYSPIHWDKIIFLLSEYARLFHMRIIMMSATLPHIDRLLPEDSPMRGKVVRLLPERDQFFSNPNFGRRVTFDFECLESRAKPQDEEAREAYLEFLVEKVLEKSEAYAQKHCRARTIIEFVKKKTAGSFFRKLRRRAEEQGYEVLLISGEILEPRRRQIIERLKAPSEKEKVILVSTQVVEAGVDIDMDLGFKDVSVPDSEEQLAGRVNRNASKQDCVVYLFDLDDKRQVYGRDLRYKAMMEWPREKREKTRKQILSSKDFASFYDKILAHLERNNADPFMAGTLSEYRECICRFNFGCMHKNLKLIDQDSLSVFVPLSIPVEPLTQSERELLRSFGISMQNGRVQGEEVWSVYKSIVEQSRDRTSDFTKNRVAIKQITSLLSLFTFSFFAGRQNHDLATYGEERLGFFYMETWRNVYTLEEGLDLEKVKDDFFL